MNIKHYLTLLFISLFLCSFSQEKSIYRGLVVDDKHEPIGYVSVVARARDSSFLAASVTDQSGSFRIECREYQPGIFVEFNHIAFAPTAIILSPEDSTNLRVQMQLKNNYLDEIEVQGRFLIPGEEGLKVNVAQLPGINNMQADKMLRQLPGVIKMRNGSYTLNGMRTDIYINDVKQNISTSSMQAYLSSLPANSIQEVDLVSINNGKYGAQTQAVINIKTNGRQPEGSSFQLRAGGSIFDSELNNAGSNIFYMIKKGKILFHTLLSYENNSSYLESVDSTTYINDLKTYSKGKTDGRYYSWISRTNFTYLLPNDQSLDVNAFIYYDKQNLKKYWELGQNKSTEAKVNRQVDHLNGNDDMWQATVTYKTPQHRLTKATFYYSGLYGGLRSKNLYRQSDSHEAYEQSHLKMTGSMQMLVANVTSKIANLNLDYGFSGEFNKMRDKTSYISLPALEEIYKSDFSGTEKIAAAYMTGRYKLMQSLSLIASIRMEYTDFDLNYRLENATSDFNYTNWLPRFYFNIKTNIYNGNLGLLSSIVRPNYEWLIPGVRRVNSFMIIQGNPSLRPEERYQLFCYNTLFSYLNLNFKYGLIKNKSGVVFTKNGENEIIQSYLNFADFNFVEANLTLPYQLFDNKIYGQFVSNMHYNKMKRVKNGFIIPDGRKTEFWEYSFQFNFNYDITNRLNANIEAQYVPNQKSLYIDTNDYGSVDVGVSYAFLNDNSLVIGFDVRNIFDSSDLKQRMYFSDISRYVYRKTKGPIFLFSIKYTLNKGQKVVEQYSNSSPNNIRMGTTK